MEIYLYKMSTFTKNIFLLIVIAFVFNINCFAEKSSDIQWQKINEKENIRVYSTEVPGSSILKIKAETIINTNISRIQSILDNVEHRKNWIPYLKDSRIIENISDQKNIEYSLFTAPWPASDREFVYEITMIFKNNSSAIYQMKSINHPGKPENESFIRADLMESSYILTALSENITQVELIYHADPKGWLPNWIINIIQRVLPYLILKNLHKQI